MSVLQSYAHGSCAWVMRMMIRRGHAHRSCARVVSSPKAARRARARLLIPDIAAEIVYCRRIEAPAQTLEVRGGGIHLCAVRGVDGCLFPLDLAVIDVHVGATRRNADAARADVTVGDVNLPAIHSAHRIPVEYQVAVV